MLVEPVTTGTEAVFLYMFKEIQGSAMGSVSLSGNHGEDCVCSYLRSSCCLQDIHFRSRPEAQVFEHSLCFVLTLLTRYVNFPPETPALTWVARFAVTGLKKKGVRASSGSLPTFQITPGYVHFAAIGAVPSPVDCYLCNRGLKTLHVRMEKHFENGMAVAQFLESNPRVEKVIYPGKLI